MRTKVSDAERAGFILKSLAMVKKTTAPKFPDTRDAALVISPEQKSVPAEKQNFPDAFVPTQNQRIPDISVPEQKQNIPNLSVPAEIQNLPDTSAPAEKRGLPDTSVPTQNQRAPDTSVSGQRQNIPNLSVPAEIQNLPDTSVHAKKRGFPDTSVPEQSQNTLVPAENQSFLDRTPPPENPPNKCFANGLPDKKLLADEDLLPGTWRIAGIYVRDVRRLAKNQLEQPDPKTDPAECDLVSFRGRLWAVGRIWSKNDTDVLSGFYWTFSADGVMAEWNEMRIRERIGYRFDPRTRKLLLGQSGPARSGTPAFHLTEAFHVEADSRDVLQLYGLEYWAWRYENAPYRFELVRADPEIPVGNLP